MACRRLPRLPMSNGDKDNYRFGDVSSSAFQRTARMLSGPASFSGFQFADSTETPESKEDNVPETEPMPQMSSSTRQSRKMSYKVKTKDQGFLAMSRSKQSPASFAVAGPSTLKIVEAFNPVSSLQDDVDFDWQPVVNRRSRRGMNRSQENLLTIRESAFLNKSTKMSPAVTFRHVDWGYGLSGTKVATACSDGRIILWNTATNTPAVDQTKHDHDRAVNASCFGGPNGALLVSAGQDGTIRLWDIRDSKSARMVLKNSSSVRQVLFSPRKDQPFILLAGTSQGLLARYDLRSSSASSSGPVTDRLAVHEGPVLSIDWQLQELRASEYRDPHSRLLPSLAMERVVTAGMDKNIKVWDVSNHRLPQSPSYTFSSHQASSHVRLHPSDHDTIVSSSSSSTVRAHESSFWPDQINFWSTKQPAYPFKSVKGPVAFSSFDFLESDPDLICACSKASSNFHVIDAANDSYSLEHSLSSGNAKISSDGLVLFSLSKEVPNEDSDTSEVGGIASFRLNFGLSVTLFKDLARAYKTNAADPLDSVRHNYLVARAHDLGDVAYFWQTVETLYPNRSTDLTSLIETNRPHGPSPHVTVSSSRSRPPKQSLKIHPKMEGAQILSGLSLANADEQNPIAHASTPESADLPKTNAGFDEQLLKYFMENKDQQDHPDPTPSLAKETESVSDASDIYEQDTESSSPQASVLHESKALNMSPSKTVVSSVSEHIRNLSDYFIQNGDVQHVAVLVALTRCDFGLGNYVVCRVLYAYMKRLKQYQLDVEAIVIAHVSDYFEKKNPQDFHAPFGSFFRLANPSGGAYRVVCRSCKKPVEHGGFCATCKHFTSRCVLCRESISGLSIICSVCGHSAHPKCLENHTSLMSAMPAEYLICPGLSCGHDNCILSGNTSTALKLN